MDVEQLTDEECYRILQKANDFAAKLLLKKIDGEDSTKDSEQLETIN